MTADVEEATRSLAARLEVASLVRSLQDVLGQPLVAVIAGVSDARTVGTWARSERTPQPEAERRLRLAFHMAHLLLQQESADTVRAWFIGINPDLGDQAPALLLAEHPRKVLAAARDFLVNG